MFSITLRIAQRRFAVSDWLSSYVTWWHNSRFHVVDSWFIYLRTILTFQSVNQSDTYSYFHCPDPGRHDTRIPCRTNAGPPSTTLAQHCSDMGSVYRDCRDCTVEVTSVTPILIMSQMYRRLILNSTTYNRFYTNSNRILDWHVLNLASVISVSM